MKAKRLSLLLVCAGIVCISLPLVADERTESWTLVYESAISDSQRLAVMSQIIEFQDRGFTPLLEKALDQLYRDQIELGDPNRVKIRSSLAVLIIKELGNIRASDAGPLLIGIYNDVKDPFIRSEAAMALGRSRLVEYVPVLVRDLADLNLAPPANGDARNQEVLAWGLVSALGLMKDMRAYETVFLSSIGWYSQVSKVRSTALATLRNLSEDPTEVLISILPKLAKYEDKQSALDLELASAAGVENRNRLARLVLFESIRTNETDVLQKTSKVQLALAALSALESGKDSSAETVVLFRELVLGKFSQDVLLATYRTAGSNSSDECARFLSEALIMYNTQQKRGLNGDNERLVIRQIVASMAKQKSPLTKDALKQAEFANHDGQVVREIKAALASY